MKSWEELKFWKSPVFEKVVRKLTHLRKSVTICPHPPLRGDTIFRPFEYTPFETVKVVIIGQDPYPDPMYATGVAFSLPKDMINYPPYFTSEEDIKIPPTFRNILQEYHSDLHYPEPETYCLLDWCHRGVMLWNTIPTCTAYNSLSHQNIGWEYLTIEIIEKLSKRGGIVFVFLGGVARDNVQFVNQDSPLFNTNILPTNRNIIIELSHPSPRGNIHSRYPFLGSRMFSRINDSLVKLGQTEIDWLLPHKPIITERIITTNELCRLAKR